METPVFFEDRARALYAARGATTSEAALEPLRRGRSYRAATRDAGILSREEARELGRTAAAGMLGCFANGGSTVLGCLTPSALASRLGVAAAARLKWCVVEMRRAAADAARLPPGTCLRLSGAFLARLRRELAGRCCRPFLLRIDAGGGADLSRSYHRSTPRGSDLETIGDPERRVGAGVRPRRRAHDTALVRLMSETEDAR